MKPLYQKPIVCNLGDILQNAQGMCMNGSVATGGKLDCLSGSNAGSAGGTACANGTAALGTCNVGAQPANNMGCKAGAGVIGN